MAYPANRSKRLFQAAAFAALLILFSIFQYSEIISATNLLKTKMWIIQHRILEYVHAKKRLPNDLSEMESSTSEDVFYDNTGRRIHYRHYRSGFVILSGFSKNVSAEDVHLAFSAKGKNGAWVAENWAPEHVVSQECNSHDVVDYEHAGTLTLNVVCP